MIGKRHALRALLLGTALLAPRGVLAETSLPTLLPETTSLPATFTDLLAPGGMQQATSLPITDVTAVPTAAPFTVDAWLLGLIGLLLGAGITLLIVLLTRKKPKQQTVSAAPETLTLAPPHVALVGNVHHIGSRASQQDAFGVSPLTEAASKGVLAVLADGMGGMNNSGALSQALVRATLAAYSTAQGSSAQVLTELCGKALVLAHRQFAEAGAGSTLVMAEVRGEWLDYAAIGDSRIALWRSGALLTLNRDHTFARQLRQQACAGVGDWQQDNPNATALTSYVGKAGEVLVDFPTAPIRLLHGDKLLMMTDGVFGTLDDTLLARLLENDAVTAAEALEKLILGQSKPHQDNFTALILEIA